MGSHPTQVTQQGRGVLCLAWWFQYQRDPIQCGVYWLRAALYTLCVPQRCETRCGFPMMFFFVGLTFLLFLNLIRGLFSERILHFAGPHLPSHIFFQGNFYQGLGCESPRSMSERMVFPPKNWILSPQTFFLMTSRRETPQNPWWMEIRNENPPLLLKMAPVIYATLYKMGYSPLTGAGFLLSTVSLGGSSSMWHFLNLSKMIGCPPQWRRMGCSLIGDAMGCLEHTCLTMLCCPGWSLDLWDKIRFVSRFFCGSFPVGTWGPKGGETDFPKATPPLCITPTQGLGRKGFVWLDVFGTTGRDGGCACFIFLLGFGGVVGDGILVGLWNANEVWDG